MSASLTTQLINLLASLMLLIGFAMLAQRRILRLIYLFALQGLVLCLNTLVVAVSVGQPHLLFSAALTLLLKVFALPWILHRLIDRLEIRWDVETLINIPTIMLVGIVVVMRVWMRHAISRDQGATPGGVEFVLPKFANGCCNIKFNL